MKYFDTTKREFNNKGISIKIGFADKIYLIPGMVWEWQKAEPKVFVRSKWQPKNSIKAEKNPGFVICTKKEIFILFLKITLKTTINKYIGQ